MPTYDYTCDACGHGFEAFQSMTEKTLRTCPKCKKPKLRRLIGTGAGIIFKGSGFYQTDYKKSGASSESSSSSKESKGSKEAKGKTDPPPKSDAGGDKSCGSCGKTGPDVCD
ncbi:MAG TPA: zinc ribbon domain-containing protein [Planctomycetota bacterium]|nr:zinc ribbon domain-containing protein [Planctomycetota bacterium]